MLQISNDSELKDKNKCSWQMDITSMNILSFAYNQKFTILFYFIIILQLLFMYFFIYLFIYLLYATPEILSEIKVFTFTLLYSIRSINIKEPLLSDSKG